MTVSDCISQQRPFKLHKLPCTDFGFDASIRFLFEHGSMFGLTAPQPIRHDDASKCLLR